MAEPAGQLARPALKEFRVRQRDIFKAQIAQGLESLAVIVSCNESNHLRNVVTVCELREDKEGKYRGLPTAVEILASKTTFEADLFVIASPYTIPKNCLISKEDSLSPQLYEMVEEALKIVFGWTPWPS